MSNTVGPRIRKATYPLSNGIVSNVLYLSALQYSRSAALKIMAIDTSVLFWLCQNKTWSITKIRFEPYCRHGRGRVRSAGVREGEAYSSAPILSSVIIYSLMERYCRKHFMDLAHHYWVIILAPNHRKNSVSSVIGSRYRPGAKQLNDS